MLVCSSQNNPPPKKRFGFRKKLLSQAWTPQKRKTQLLVSRWFIKSKNQPFPSNKDRKTPPSLHPPPQRKRNKYRQIPCLKLTVRTWKWMLGRFTDFLLGKPSDRQVPIMLVSGSVIGIPKQQKKLGGGNSNMFYFSSRSLGFHDPIWLAHIFQMGWWTTTN